MHQGETRVADQGCTGVTDQRNALSFTQASEQLVQHFPFIMLMHCDNGPSDAKMPQQRGAVAGILGSDQVSLGQHPDGARRHVFQVADGCRHHVERSGFV